MCVILPWFLDNKQLIQVTTNSNSRYINIQIYIYLNLELLNYVKLP